MTPAFLGVLAFLTTPRLPGALVAAGALIASGFLLLWLVPKPGRLVWVWVSSVVPSVCCGLAALETGQHGLTYAAVLGAPIAWGVLLFDEVVASWAFGVSLFVFLGIEAATVGPAEAAGNAVVFGCVYGLVVWAGKQKTALLREARSEVERERARLAALLSAVPDVVARFDLQGRVLDVFVPAGSPVPGPREQLLTQSVRDLVEPAEAADFLAAIQRVVDTGVPSERSYASDSPGGRRHFHARVVRAGPNEVVVVRRDVTAEVHERELESDRLRLESIGDRTFEAEFLFRPDGSLVHANKRALAMYGYTRDEFAHLNVRDLRAPETVSQLAEQVRRAATEGLRFETVHRSRDGKRFPVEVSSCAIVLNGETYLHSLVRDVSDRKAAERALKDSEEQLRSIFAAMAEGVVLQDALGHIVTCNAAAERILGLTRDQLAGRTSMDPRWRSVREDGAPFSGDTHPAMEALRTGQQKLGVLMGVDAPGRGRRWISINAEPLRLDPAGAPYAVVTTFTDITEAKESAEALRRSEVRLRHVLSGSQDGFFELDVSTGASTRSPRTAGLLGLLPEELAPGFVGWLERVHPDDQGRFREAMQAAVRGAANTMDVEYRILAADGSWRWCRTRAQRFNDGVEGHEVTIAGVITDVTAEREALLRVKSTLAEKVALADELSHANQTVTRAAEAKSHFLANMSHEIRTPLNAIVGMSALALEESLSPKAQDYVHTVHQAAEGLVAVVNDVLDFSKIEAGRLTLERIVVDLPALLREAAALFRTMAAAKKVELTVQLDPALPTHVMSDPLRVRQVLTNLLSNALKFTPAGVVTLSARPGPTADVVEVTVTDTGVGMSAAQVSQLFTVFTQADQSTARRFGGTGLGLSISRDLAHALGGDLTATSEEDHGSRFTFTFLARVPTPAERNEASSRRAFNFTAAADVLRGRSVLVAEDNPINQQLARRLLEKVGMQVSVLGNGQLAAAAVTQGPGAWDVVLMDIQMPVLDGLEATRLIRATLGDAAPPIVAMSANALADQRAEAHAAGMVDHVPKPIDVNRLYETLMRVLEGRPSRDAAARRPTPPAPPRAS